MKKERMPRPLPKIYLALLGRKTVPAGVFFWGKKAENMPTEVIRPFERNNRPSTARFV
jgi:hypothetical protein